MVVTPTKLTLRDPFHWGQSNGDGSRSALYTKTGAPSISSQSNPRNGHLSVSVTPTWTEATAQPVRKMGVASLLFHKTLSSKDTLQVHSYTLEKKREPHTRLQVHSYAREHQPRHVQNKMTPKTQVHSSSQKICCEKTKPESPVILSEIIHHGKGVHSPVLQDEEENKPRVLMPIEGLMEIKVPAVELTSKSCNSQTQTLQDINRLTVVTPKTNKQKVCVFTFFKFIEKPIKNGKRREG